MGPVRQGSGEPADGASASRSSGCDAAGVKRCVPELICSDLGASLAFYRLLGFRVAYDRPAERFAYLERDGAGLMLEQPIRRDRLFPRAELIRPYGRGINLTIEVDDVASLHARILDGGAAVVLPLEQRWYDRVLDSVQVRQFAVADPDGYVLRIAEDIATRPAR